MKDIFYNAAVAKRCGTNGIIKAVLINYIYNYHKPNPRKKVGDPAQIALAEFVYQYQSEDTALWKRSCIHKTLKALITDGHLTMTRESNQPVYTVSAEIARFLAYEKAIIVSFDLKTACKHGIHIAIMSRFLLHVIDHSPHGEAYNLAVNEMAEINRLSQAGIYRAIKYLVERKVLKRVKSHLKSHSRALSLARY